MITAAALSEGSTTMHAGTVSLAVEPATAPASVSGVAAGVGTSVIVIILLAWWIHRAIEKKKIKTGHLVGAFVMGVLLAGSMIGGIAKTTTNSLGTGVMSVLGGITGTGR